MIPIIGKIFGKKSSRVQDFIETVKKISVLSNEIEKKKTKLDDLKYELLTKNKDEVFISLADFLNLLEKEDLNINDIMDKCQHISELSNVHSSFISVHTIVEDDHLVLCPDIKTCARHHDYEGEKIKITTIRVED